MYCIYCGAKNEDNQKFCAECGREIRQLNKEQPKQDSETETVKKQKTILLIGLAFLVLLVVFSVNFIFSADSFTKEISKKNRQIQATNMLERDAGTNMNYYKYSLANGGKYLSAVYGFEGEPPNINFLSDYDEKCATKFIYVYNQSKMKNEMKINWYYRESENEDAELLEVYYIVTDEEYDSDLSSFSSFSASGENLYQEEYVRFIYDDNGKITKKEDVENNENSYYYYDQGGLLSVINSDNGNDYAYSYEKDENGNISSITKYKNNSAYRYSEYEYDSNNNIIKEFYYYFDSDGEQQLVKTYSYEYDENNNLIKQTVETYSKYSGEYSNTETTAYYYDNNYNLSRVTQSDEDITVSYVFIYSDSPTVY